MELGYVTSIEQNHKPIETARKGMEVCIKIEPIPGESPKMFGRHFDEKDFLVSKVSGIDYLKILCIMSRILMQFGNPNTGCRLYAEHLMLW